MSKLLVILFVALTFETTGVILLSKGLKELAGPRDYSITELLRVVGRAITNHYIVLGVFFEAIFFIGLLIMMANADVSFVWPLTALTFVFSTIAAKFYLHEQIDGLRWLGVIFIVAGAGLITYTEKKKERPQPGSVMMRSTEYPRV